MTTILEMSLQVSRSPEHWYILKGDFLDTFYRSHNATRSLMVYKEPQFASHVQPRIVAYTAGMVERLCNTHKIELPNWVFKEKYYLKDPDFGGDLSRELRLIYMIESPLEFQFRNVFTSKNTLDRT